MAAPKASRMPEIARKSPAGGNGRSADAPRSKASRHVLYRERDLRPHEDDQPAELDPHEEERQGGEASVDGVGLHHTDLERYVEPLGAPNPFAMPKNTAMTGTTESME